MAALAGALPIAPVPGGVQRLCQQKHRVFDSDKVCFSGSADTTGTAEKTAKGYIINGYWQHAALANDATAFVLNCVETKNGDPVKGDDGTVQLVRVLLLSEEVTIMPTWNGMGLTATASHDFEVKNITVPIERILDTNEPKSQLALYQFPQLYLFESAIAVTMLGMTTHFVDLCKLLFTEKKNKSGIYLSRAIPT